MITLRSYFKQLLWSTDQLAEIRGMSMSRLLCDVGDGVSEIQPKAFVLPGSE